MLSISFNPLIPFWLIMTLVAMVGLSSILAFVKHQPGSLMRALAGGIMVLLLFDPGVVIEEREAIRDVAIVLVDETGSQKLGGRAQITEDILAQISANLSDFSTQMDVRIVRLSHQSIADGEKGSHLFEALRQATSDIPRGRLAGAMLITDGRVHDMPLAEIKASFPAPIHTILTGLTEERDRRLEVIRSTNYGIVGQEGEITLIIHDDGKKGAPAELHLSVDGKDIGREIVPVGIEQTIKIPITKRGKTIVSLSLSPMEGELTDKNNQAVISISGVRDRLRVLLISGVPHQGERTWRNLLKADPSVDLVHFTILRPPEKQDGTPIHELSLIAFPTRELFETKLNDFDLVVFDRYRRRGVLPTLYLSNIVEYVKNGGALLEVDGPGFAGPFSLYQSPLAELLPGAPTGAVIERGFQPKLTEAGLRHPVTSQLSGGPLISLKDKVNWGRWFRQVEVTSRAGHVLMEGLDENPLLILNHVQDGRVAQLASDHIWLWSHGFEGGGPHGEFIRRLSHWLMKEPELEENDLSGSVEGSQLIVKLRSLLTVDPIVDVTDPNGKLTAIRLKHRGNGRYTGSLTVQDVGLYKLDDGDKSIFVPVGPLNPVEYMKVTASDETIGPMTMPTGGKIYWAHSGIPSIKHISQGRTMGSKDWLGLKRNNDYRVTGLERLSLIPGILAIFLVVGCLIFAWRREAD